MGSTDSFTESEVKILPALEYLAAHDLTVHGNGQNDNVPEPMQTFESAGFPRDILDEVSFLIMTRPALSIFMSHFLEFRKGT